MQKSEKQVKSSSALNLRVSRSLMGRGEIDIVLTVDGKTANTVKVNIH